MLGHKKRQFTLAVQVWALADKGDAVFAEWYGGSVISKGLTLSGVGLSYFAGSKKLELNLKHEDVILHL